MKLSLQNGKGHTDPLREGQCLSKRLLAMFGIAKLTLSLAQAIHGCYLISTVADLLESLGRFLAQDERSPRIALKGANVVTLTHPQRTPKVILIMKMWPLRHHGFRSL